MKEYKDYLKRVQEREKQLLSKVLECFKEHKENTLKDLKVLKHNLFLKGGEKE